MPPGIDELDLPLALGALSVRDYSDIGENPGVVEKLVRQCDDAIQSIVLDDPAADVALAGARITGKQR